MTLPVESRWAGRKDPLIFTTLLYVHLFVPLTTLVFSPLFVCVSRDPGTVPLDEDCVEEVELKYVLVSTEFKA